MPTSWADSADKEPAASGTAATSRVSQSTYVPPHLRNKPPTSNPPAAPFSYASAASGNDRHGGYGAPSQRYDKSDGGARSGGWNNRNGSWDRQRESDFNHNPDVTELGDAFGEVENTGINFDAYEDIPVETSGNDVPPPVSTFAEIDLGESLNQNIRRCKYVKPTPVQRYTIPISIAGRDLMACAQTGSGKTAAFCFPIISGIMRNSQSDPRPTRMPQMSFPSTLILSPTRELSIQIHEEAKKFAYQTGVRVVVAYGGAPINLQRLASDFLSNYVFLAVGRVGSSTDLIVQRVEYVLEADKRSHLMDPHPCTKGKWSS